MDNYTDVYSYLNTLKFTAAGGGFLAPQNIARGIFQEGIDSSIYLNFMQNADNSFGLGMGTVFQFKTLNRVSNEVIGSTLAPLSSGTSIEHYGWEYGSHQISANEYGFGYSIENWARYASAEDLLSDMTGLTAQHLKVHLDSLARNEIYSCYYSITMFGTAGSYYYGTNAPLTGASGDLNNRKYFDTYADAGSVVASGSVLGGGAITAGALAFAYDKLKSSPFTTSINGKYPAILNTRTARQVRNLLRFENNVQMPQIPDVTYLGEAEGFVWFETEENTQDGVIAIPPVGAFGYGFAKAPQIYVYPDFHQDAGRANANKVHFGVGMGKLQEAFANANSKVASLLIKVGLSDEDYMQY